MTYTDDTPPLVDPTPPPPDPWDHPEPTRDPHDRTPPSDPAAEAAVLGAAMVTPRAFDLCAKHVTAADFYRPNHETIWRTIASLHAAGEPTEPTAVVARLLDQQLLNKVGGGPYIHELMQAAPLVAEHAEHYARRIDSLARRRAAATVLARGLQILNNPGADTDVDHVLNTTTTALTEARDNLAGLPTPTTWTPVDLDPVLAGEHLDPPPAMLMRADGVFLLYDGAVHTISGESESGKTWLTLIAAIQLLADGDRVVFLDFEDRADRVIGRLLALGATPEQIRTHFAYIRPDRPLDDDGRNQLAPALNDARLVIVDGVTEAMTMHGFDLNSNADSALFQGLIPRWIADHGPAVVMIDHVVKDKEKQDRFAVGAQHKLAGIDGAAYMVKMLQPFGRGKRGLARVDVAKDRPGHVREHTHGRTIAEFTLDATRSDVILTAHLNPPGTDTGRTHGDTFEPTILMEKISRAVQLTPGLSKKALEDITTGKTPTKRLAIELLVTRGYIQARPEARGRVAHYHVKPYYADGEPDSETTSDTPNEGATA